jgi:hypothetical protein
MEFNVYQLSLIEEIKVGNIYDLTSYIKRNFDIISHNLNENDYEQLFVLSNFDKIKIKNVKEAYYYCFNLFSLIEFLKNSKLIYYLETRDQLNITFEADYEDEKTKLYITLINKLFKRNNILFYPSEEINSFIDRNYETIEEKKVFVEDNDRKEALKWTKVIAIISICLSIITTVYNIFMYNNFRNVTLQNQKDTIKVIIIDTLKTVK